MHSPKFPAKALHLKNTISAAALRSLWTKSVRQQMRKQILPDPVEYLDFHTGIRQRSAEIESTVLSGEYTTRRVIRLKFEKSKGLCRQVVLPSPEDALVLQALSNSLWRVIHPKSPSANSFYAPQDQPFAKVQISGDDNEWGYGPIEAWLDFQKTILKFSTIRKYIVVTDVANYYDSILHSFLRAILSEYAEEKEHALDLLLYVIDSMLWRPDYMPNYGIGIPQMNLDAPRLLAHTHLFEIDDLFTSDPGIDFARYMDDMDFGVDSIAKAKTVLRDLDLALQTRNLRLNSGKTRILTASEARQHFRLEDNLAADRLHNKSLMAADRPSRSRLWHAALRNRISVGVASDKYEAGNGGKVLKRLLNMATKNSVSLPDATVRKLIYNAPALRESVLRNWSSNENAELKLSLFSGFLRSGEAVDDVAAIQIATFFVQARILNSIDPTAYKLFLGSFDRTDPYGLFCRLWIISRFGSASELKSEIDNSNQIWSRYSFLVRLVAGFSGLFRLTPHFLAFEGFTRRWGGVDGAAMLDFHDAIAKDKAGYHSVRKFIEAPSSTLPNETTHSKVLILASMLSNPVIPKIHRAQLLAKRANMMNDYYYRSQLSTVISAAP